MIPSLPSGSTPLAGIRMGMSLLSYVSSIHLDARYLLTS
jgi:hypothetical protein